MSNDRVQGDSLDLDRVDVDYNAIHICCRRSLCSNDRLKIVLGQSAETGTQLFCALPWRR
jgi:hypothetical protein